MSCPCTYEIAELHSDITIMFLAITPLILVTLSGILMILGIMLKNMINKRNDRFNHEQVRLLGFLEKFATWGSVLLTIAGFGLLLIFLLVVLH